MSLIICRPSTFYWRSIRYCPTEGRKRRFVMAEAVWYGTAAMCCGCGDKWDLKFGRFQRPFGRQWRRKAIKKHRELWKQARTKREAWDWIKDQLGSEAVAA